MRQSASITYKWGMSSPQRSGLDLDAFRSLESNDFQAVANAGKHVPKVPWIFQVELP